MIGQWAPGATPVSWAMIAMAAMMGGTMRVAVDRHDIRPGELSARSGTRCQRCWSARVATLSGRDRVAPRRSILTEKLARRGYHVSSEYAIDPLELLYAREVMRVPDVILPADGTAPDALQLMSADISEKQRLLPVVDERGLLAGVLTRKGLQDQLANPSWRECPSLRELMRTEVVAVFADDPLRVVVNRMAEKGVTRMPVVERADGRSLGLISLDDLLKARSRHLEEEERREADSLATLIWTRTTGVGQVQLLRRPTTQSA